MNFSLDQSWGIESVSQNFKEDDGKTRMGSWHKRRDLPIWEKQIAVDDQDPLFDDSVWVEKNDARQVPIWYLSCTYLAHIIYLYGTYPLPIHYLSIT